MSRIPLMPWRLDEVRATMEGYERSGIPLVALRDGRLGPAGFPDDPGLFYVVPAVARTFGLSADGAFDALVFGLLSAAALLGAAGAWALFRTARARAVAIAVVLAVVAVVSRVGDVYVVAPALAVAFVPLLLHLTRRGALGRLAVALFGLGLAAGVAHAIRSHSATATILFALVLVGGAAALVPRRRLAAVAALAAGLLLSSIGMRTAIAQRDAYLSSVDASYDAAVARHAFWHSVYIGMGFVDNPHVAEYRDEIAFARAAQLAPDAPLYSPAYESALRGDVLRIVAAAPFFVMRLVAAKVGVIAMYLLLAANVGLVVAVRRPPSRIVLLAFGVALSFSALFGILAVPTSTYLSGFVAFAALFGAVSMSRLLDGRDRAPMGDSRIREAV